MDGYTQAAALLPERLRVSALEVRERDRREAMEFRLRIGRRAALLLPEGERTLPGGVIVSSDVLKYVLTAASCASPYAIETLHSGFITAAGAVRVGFCGEAVTGSSGIRTLKDLSSAALRIPREVRGCALGLEQGFVSTLIVSPPGMGKTTLLRDLIRLLSDGGARVGLCDDRGEVAACRDGVPGFDIGERTDVITGGDKSESALMLLRSMNPTVLAMDEITAPRDADACESVSNCGVLLLATAHGRDVEELQGRRVYRALLDKGVFRRALVLRVQGGRRETEEIWL